MSREKLFSVTIKDCELQTFKAGGKGGQYQNKTDSAVRIIHPPSGARGESREERSQSANKKKAFRRMAESEKFQKWAQLEAAKRVGEIDRWIDEQMAEINLDIEYLS